MNEAPDKKILLKNQYLTLKTSKILNELPRLNWQRILLPWSPQIIQNASHVPDTMMSYHLVHANNIWQRSFRLHLVSWWLFQRKPMDRFLAWKRFFYKIIAESWSPNFLQLHKLWSLGKTRTHRVFQRVSFHLNLQNCILDKFALYFHVSR